MADASTIVALAQTFVSAKNIASSMIGLKVTSEVQGKVVELNNYIIEAQGHLMTTQVENAALLARITELEKQIVGLKRQSGALGDYQLTEVGAGATVYRMKPDVETSEPPHWICVACFTNNHLSILQLDAIFSHGQIDIYACPNCKNEINVVKGVHP